MSQAAASSIELRTSPHLRSPKTVDVIMRNVVYALLPICAFAVWNFGISALALIVVCTGVAVLTEHVYCVFAKKPTTVGDWSVVITGILVALILPPALPLWMAAVTSFISVALGKIFFGGLGYNVFNPALVGRAFSQVAFTLPMTTWTPAQLPGRFFEFIPTSLTIPFLEPGSLQGWLSSVAPDGWTGATPLQLMKSEQTGTEVSQLLFGSVAGSTGETAAVLILVCGLYLVVRKMMNWRITFSILVTAALFSWLFYVIDPSQYPDPVFMLGAGSLMLGAVFMATDMVSSPETRLGVWVYGVFIGVMVVVIRLFGGLPEGVMYAILLGNAVSPLISRVTQPKTYGAVRKNRKQAKEGV